MSTTFQDDQMQVSRGDLHAAANAGVITSTQIDPLIAFLRAHAPATPHTPPTGQPATFDMVHLFWYAGALVVMAAMGLFTTLAFSKMGGAALTLTAVIYAVALGFAGDHLWRVRKLRTPGGLLIAVAVSMAPLAVYGIQDATGAWSQFGRPGAMRDFYIWIKGSWLFMELATIVAAVVALRFYRFPFIVLPLAIALWFLSMDIVPWITGRPHGSWDTSRLVSIWFGLGMILTAFAVSLRQRSGDFAFWLYLFGILTFWGAITVTSDSTDFTRGLYCLLNIGFLLLSVVLARRVFAVFGAMGLATYLGHLAYATFKDSMLFPFALSLIGLAIIALGLYLHRHRAAIEARITPRLPPVVQRLRTQQWERG